MLQVDALIRWLFQGCYDVLWDCFGVPIGTFRILIAFVPLISDLSLRIYTGSPQTALFGLCVFLTGVLLFYAPSRVTTDNKLQARGQHVRLNASALHFARRTLTLRLFYLGLFTFNLITFHHFQGFALFDIVYARCILVRARQEPQTRSSLQPSAA